MLRDSLVVYAMIASPTRVSICEARDRAMFIIRGRQSDQSTIRAFQNLDLQTPSIFRRPEQTRNLLVDSFDMDALLFPCRLPHAYMILSALQDFAYAVNSAHQPQQQRWGGIGGRQPSVNLTGAQLHSQTVSAARAPSVKSGTSHASTSCLKLIDRPSTVHYLLSHQQSDFSHASRHLHSKTVRCCSR